MLQKDLFDNPAAVARIPVGGYLTMAITPVLLVLSAVSPRSRRRCVEYLDAQMVLLESTLRVAVARKRLSDQAGTEQLRAFLRTSMALRTALESAPPEGKTRASRDATNIESWMGLSGSSAPGSLPDGRNARRTV